MNGGFGLSTQQLKTVSNFVQLLMNSAKNGNPSSLQDIMALLRSTGLFNAISQNMGNVSEICDNLKDMNIDMDAVKNLTKTLGIPLPANMTLTDVTDWCQQLANKTVPKIPGWVHSPYDWPKCQSEVTKTLQGLTKAETWALEMLDASAKPGSSILRGNLKFLGNYKQCQEVFHKDISTFSHIQGKVCRAYISAPSSLGLPALPGQDVKIQWDICLPKSCQDNDLNLALYEQSLSKDVWIQCTKEFDMSQDGAAIFAIGLLILFGVLLVAGTIMEFCIKHQGPHYNHQDYVTNGHVISGNGHAVINKGFESIEGNHVSTTFTEPNGKPAMLETAYMNGGDVEKRNGHNGTAIRFAEAPNGSVVHGKDEDKDKHKIDIKTLPRWQRALLAFSIPRNTEKILSVKAAPGAIGCLHGIRVLSMGWVILGHVIIFQGTSGQYDNPMDIFSLVNTLGFQLILNAPLSVDTFFLMSGFLTCFLFMKTLGKKKRITIKEFVMYYVHRYWRLTPSLMIWIMVVACLLKYVGEGRPAWTDYPAAENCRKNWWVNLLYINNVYKQEESCVGVTWFLAHDMQFYIVAPLALIPWVYGLKIIGFLVSIVFIGIHLASTIWLEIKYNGDLLRNQPDYSNEIYFKPYSRIAPFAIGLMLGWFMWKINCKAKMNKCLVSLGWMVSIGLILTLTLVTYDQNRDFNDSWSHTSRVAFETLYRPLWSVAMSWLIFACATGYGGYINSILSWNGWLPLSRLTYSAFLIHLTILGYEAMAPEYKMLFTLTSLSYQFIGFFVMSYAVGYVLTVAVESPMLGLEKVILG